MKTIKNKSRPNAVRSILPSSPTNSLNPTPDAKSPQVETEEDLRALWALLDAVNEGQPPPARVVLTPFWIAAGPDFEEMRDAGCLDGADTCAYKELWWHNSSGGLDRPPFSRGDLRALYKEGFDRGLWHPEYHGRSHLDATAWVAYLRDMDTVRFDCKHCNTAPGTFSL